jgi:hypothetical protein
MALEFNPDNHEYKFDGVVKPSVTQILNSVDIPDLSGIPENVLDEAMVRGKAVHFATEIFDLGEYEKYDIDDMCLKCCRQWEFLRNTILKKHDLKIGLLNQAIEEPIYSKEYGYCGTPDRCYYDYNNRIAVIIDIKTGITAKQARPQTAAYAQLMKENCGVNFKNIFRYSAHLFFDKDTGRLEEHKNKCDFNIFLSALNIYKFKKGLI